MNEIRTVLATVPYRDDDLDQLRRGFTGAEFVHCDAADDATIRAVLRRADVAVLNGDLDERFLSAPKLGWVHCDHAGLNRSARPEVFERGLIVTGSAGRSAASLAQHGFFFALSLLYDVRALLAAQAEHRWRGAPHVERKHALWGKTLGIVGFGHTGREMAAIGRVFGMRVVVYRRSVSVPSSDVDLMLSARAGHSLDLLLDEADVIMLAASLSDATHHLFAAEQFRRMKPHSVIVNMARGGLIDEAALIDALRTGEIAGAGLDVFETEPLPPESPLWNLTNVILTPHVTPQMPDKTQRSIDTIVENIRRYRAGEPLLNAIAPRDLYTPKVEQHHNRQEEQT
jgi:phosphoglycerate dehydrogenase-like enzyme